MVELETGRDDLPRRPARRRDVRRPVGHACGSSKGDKIVAELGRGHHFGEMALVDRSTRSLTAIGDRGHAPRRHPPQGLLRAHQARARARGEDAVELRPGARPAAAQDERRICPTRCTATQRGTDDREREPSRRTNREP